MRKRGERITGLPSEIAEWVVSIEGMARDFGLDFFDTIFEMVGHEEMNEIAALVGFPVRYPHWHFGMEFERLQKSYTYGLHKIYEMVINTDPCYAYLLRSNSMTDHKLVIAHVYAHCDFFKNNTWFSKTNRKMVDEMANHRARTRRYIEKYGHDRVEDFLDACLSLETLTDPQALFHEKPPVTESAASEEPGRDFTVPRLHASKRYLEDFINPKEYLEEQRRRLEEIANQRRRYPEKPNRDVLGFLVQHAPLEKWEADLLSIIREEGLYFMPQGQTKIMNEGWATYWHSRLMTEKILDGEDLIDYADHHSGTVAQSPGRLNPYKLGLELFRHIKRRWDRGRFGREYEECDDYLKRKNWDTKALLGDEKIFEVRRVYNDIGFVDTFLDEDFVDDHRLFAYSQNEKTGRIEVDTRAYEKVKQNLLMGLTNHGKPFIYVEDANFMNRAELLLWHDHIGLDLQIAYAQPTLENLYKIWRRPVNIRTILAGKPIIMRFDGETHSEMDIEKEGTEEPESTGVEAD